MDPLNVLLLGTCDTKLPELLYIRSRMMHHNPQAHISLIDVGRSPVSHPAITIPQQEIVSRYLLQRTPEDSPDSPDFEPLDVDLAKLPRSEVMAHMTRGATACLWALVKTQTIHAVVAIGGSSGTSLAATAMREAVPLTLPKLIVSTVASGDVASFVQENDITMMYSIVDIAGSNRILDGVLDNAAGAVVGMAAAYRLRLAESKNEKESQSEGSETGIGDGFEDGRVEEKKEKEKKKKKIRIGITMFGVTTPCVDTIRQHLTSNHANYELYIFHATGHGGRAMERLIASGELDAVLDLTTTEIADHIVGGVMSAGPHRLSAAAKAGIPQVVSVGACDMVNFGPRGTVPEKFSKAQGGGGRERNIYEHNPSVTLMRTDKKECKQIGEFIAGQLRKFGREASRVQVVLPVGGVSMISKPGDPFHDPEADEALFEAIEGGLEGSGIEVLRDERDVNDEGFALEIARRLVRLVELSEK